MDCWIHGEGSEAGCGTTPCAQSQTHRADSANSSGRAGSRWLAELLETRRSRTSLPFESSVRRVLESYRKRISQGGDILCGQPRECALLRGPRSLSAGNDRACLSFRENKLKVWRRSSKIMRLKPSTPHSSLLRGCSLSLPTRRDGRAWCFEDSGFAII